jgi:hypothetical protein
MKIRFGLLTFIPSLALGQAPAFQTFDLGHVVEQAEAIKAARAQRELLEAQAAAERARIAREQEVAQRIEAPPPIAAQAESVSESDVRFLKFLSQDDACQQLYKSDVERMKCINQLKISDPDYARTWVEITIPGVETEQTHTRRVQLFALYKQTRPPASTKPNVADDPARPR